MNRIKSLVAIALLALFPMSCLRTGLPAKRFRTHEEAGSMTVSIQSIAPFDEQYIEQLQPKIDLPSDAAAIAQTQIRQIQQLRALLIAAGLSLPSTTVDETKTTTLKPTEGEKVDFTRTEKTTPPSSTAPAAPTVDTTLPTPIDLTSTTLTLDAALNSRALAALRQEIALLNRYVRDAAVTRGTRPYVVRLLVTLTPSARFEPYDAYAAISLFSASATTNIPDLALDQVRSTIVRELTQKAATITCGGAMEVIPLFVTDNIESSLDSLAGRRALGLQGAASGTVQNVGANLGANFQSQDVEKAQARTLNSLQTIGRLSSNTVEARFGAMNTAGSYQMLSRTYNVTVLALVPTLRGYLDGLQGTEFVASDDEEGQGDRLQRVTPAQRYTDVAKAFKTGVLRSTDAEAAADVERLRSVADEVLLCNDVAFTALSRFVDVDSGRTLRSGFASRSENHLRGVAATWKLPRDTTTLASLRDLLTYAQYDAFGEFRSALKTGVGVTRPDLANRDEAVRMFWLDMVSVARNSGRLHGRFALPQDGFSFFTTNNGATLFDNGTTSEITLVGSKNLTSTALDAVLEVDGRIILPASAVTVSRDGRRASFSFPSPSKLLNTKTPADKPKVEPASITMRVARGGGSKPYEPQISHVWPAALPAAPNTARLTYVFVPETPKPKPPEAEMVVTAPHVVITGNDATGTLAVAFRSPKPEAPLSVRFNVDGGYIVSTTPETRSADADRVAVANGTYVLTVRNLARGGKLTVNAFQTDDKGNRGPALTSRMIDVLGAPETIERRGVTP